MCGQLAKDCGSVQICGRDLDRDGDTVKRNLGVVFQSSVLDQKLSVRDNLISRAALYGVTGKALERRRIDIVRALLHSPKILVLDEPTTGLDPQTRKLLWDAISHMRREQHMTVFLTTHYMEEAADADFIVILDSGKIAAEGTPLALKNAYTGDFITMYGVAEEAVRELGYPYEAIRDAYRVAVPDTAAATRLIMQTPELFQDYEITKGKMDDVFLAVTGKQLTGGTKR